MMKVSGIKQARVLFQDSRMIEGFILKCDLYMNTVVSNSYEYRLNKNTNKWEKRKLGLCVIRGNSVVTITLI
jgi:small nuclear ribonucleoprotein (snRNP)-like protein